MISISEALETIEKHVVTLSTEKIDLAESVGRVLAEDIFSDSDLPPFHRSQMDGFAVRTKDIETTSKKDSVKLKIIGESVAGKGFDDKVKKAKPSEL